MSLRMIGAAIGHGAQDPESQNAPDVVRVSGLAKMIEESAEKNGNDRFEEASWDTTLYPHFTKRFRKDLPVVGDFSERLQKVVSRVHSDGDFPLIIGGDHSCAIGTWSGIARSLNETGQESIGLVWVDAHLDSHTFETSSSWAIHGMPLACLLGKGQKSLANCAGFAPKLEASRTVIIGARSWESGERELLDHLGVKIFEAEEVFEKGLESVLLEAVSIASCNGSGLWGLTIDLDAFDPDFAPGVCSPEKNGLNPKEFTEIMCKEKFGRDINFRALEIVEFAPKYDKDGKTLEVLKMLALALAA